MVDCYPVHRYADIGLSLFIMVGLVVSYAPQVN